MFNEYIKNLIGENKITGACFRVACDGKTVAEGCEGYVDVEKSNPISEKSVFRMASMSKPITAVAILICEEKGLLSVEDEISKFIPAFKESFIGKVENGKAVKCQKTENPIRIKHLLTHSSGLGGAELSNLQTSEFVSNHGLKDIRDSVSAYSDFSLEFEPFTATQYSGFVAFDILSRIVEIVSGTEYSEFLKKEIFEPLEMKNTGFDYASFNEKDKVGLYSFDNGELKAVPTVKCCFEAFPNGYEGGGAGICSTLEDYSHFAEALACFGEYHGRRILKKSSVERMRTRLIDSWGLSVYVRGEESVLPNGSFGWSGAYGTHFFVYPERKLYGVYMHNSKTFGGAGAQHMNDFEATVMKTLGL